MDHSFMELDGFLISKPVQDLFSFHDFFSLSSRKENLLFADGLVNGKEIRIDRLSGFAIDSDEDGFENLIGDQSEGAWVKLIFNKEKQEIKINTDFLGFYRLFYTLPANNSAGVFAISNRFDYLVYFLRRNKANLNLDSDFLLPTLGSCDLFFNHPYSDDTSCGSIKTLGVGESIIVSRSDVFIKKNQASMLFVDRKSSYKDLLGIGIERAVSKIKNISTNIDASKKLISMSGGKDSRTCLAIYLAAMGHKDLSLTSKDPDLIENKQSRKTVETDFNIASFIGNFYKITPAGSDFRERVYCSFDDSLNHWMSHNSNNYFAYFYPSSSYIKGGGANCYLDVMGGGGEVLRKSELYDRLLRVADGKVNFENIAQSVETDLSKIFRLLVKGLPRDARFVSAMDYFVHDMKKIPGDNVEEILNNRYLLRRNSRHFGIQRRAAKNGRFICLPLVQPEFYWAANKIDLNLKKSGKLIFDIINECRPDLNMFDYQSGWWEREVTESSPEIGLRMMAESVGGAVYGNKLRERRSITQDINAPVESRVVADYVLRRIKSNIELLRDAGLVGDILENYLYKKIVANKSLAGLVLVKTESAVQVVRNSSFSIKEKII
ncbi:hypothetical protein [Alcaligenes sp. GCM10023179]|uniref:hypothetical protein n=1 Tax=Alcaligenes sp. GCM10023179 TaxID=3252633 RepID=UPI0036197CFC